jgi:hypothetical protein
MRPFLECLSSKVPHASLGEHAGTYGRLIGSWRGEFHAYPLGSEAIHSSAEVHFAWVLDGRAVQDVWITPSLADRAAGVRGAREMYGMTLRVFDAKSQSWRVLWVDPASGNRSELEGRRQGDDIVQIGTQAGWPIRWTISEIGDRSFLWQGHVLNPDGVTWRLQAEFRLQRMEG